MAATRLSVDNINELIDSFNTVLFDCDGVLWTGRKQVDRASETINYLKSKGKQIFYVTNNSTKTRDQYLTKLTQLGFQAEKVNLHSSPLKIYHFNSLKMFIG